MIPSKIKVAGIDYEVHEVDGILERFNTLGQINYHKGIIELDSSLCRTRKEQTFVHELLHACFKEAGYDEQDEEMIDRVSAVLYQVLKDNHFTFGGNENEEYFQDDRPLSEKQLEQIGDYVWRIIPI